MEFAGSVVRYQDLDKLPAGSPFLNPFSYETFEADPKTGLISDQSPVGKALIGHHVGDEVSVATPGGVTTYTILTIRPML